MDAGNLEEDEDTGAIEEQDAGDAGNEMDAGEDAASEGGAPYVDGCVPGPNGGCATCDADAYVEDKSCGIGCFDTPSRCVKGIEYPCLRGGPLSRDDTTCDGVDDNCNGIKDEDYLVEVSSCGIGVCTVTGGLVCERGEVRNTCVSSVAMSVRDDATGSGNGLDDDCDGSIDEDVSTCTNTAPRPYEMGTHNIAVPMGCGTVTIQLWGGGGAAGERAGITEVRPGGKGGSGGYVRSMLTVTGPITLHVGGGASPSCPPLAGYSVGGSNAGAPTYAGGAGSGARRFGEDGDGFPGQDGMVAMGGKGAVNLLGLGRNGGNGFYGGGGGGDGWADFVNGLLPEHGGGGGAASVAYMNGARVLVAGGGGGGGAAATLVYAFGDTGGKGGEGCSGNGTSGNNARVGGGGGGGVCIGMVRSMGTNGEPANALSLPRGIARGNADCDLPGGNGYAIVTFAR